MKLKMKAAYYVTFMSLLFVPATLIAIAPCTMLDAFLEAPSDSLAIAATASLSAPTSVKMTIGITNLYKV
jgi:hypothetical protein